MRIIIFIIALLVSTPVYAMTYFLSQDEGVSGFQHYCTYSNGKTYSFRSTQLCPMSIEEQGIDFGGRATGFKSGEYRDGLTKVCVYNVMGNQRALRLDSFELCPLSYDF